MKKTKIKPKLTKLKHLLIAIIALMSYSYTTAQEQVIKGVVTDESNLPLVGVSILVENTNKGTVSDFDGNYEIKVNTGDKLIFSSIGYITKPITVGSQTTINLVMQEDLAELDEVVVVGYGTQRKIEVTGAVGSVKADILNKAPVSDIGAAIQGQVAGVNIQASSGRPGEEANIQIRGVGSLSAGSLGPLYVVDGVPFFQNPNIAPEQIESIDILKDAASAAVYGVRGANGVILITTKKGEKGKLKVDYSTYTAVQNVTSGLSLLNTKQQLFSDQTVNDADGTVSNVFFLNPNALDFDSDFVEDVQKNNALINNHSINISGGTGDLLLNLNSSYFDQEGVLINSGFDRLTTRISGQYRKERLFVSSSIGITDETRQQEPFALLEFAIGQKPYQPPIADVQPVNGVVQLGVGSGQPELLSFLTRLINDRDDRKIRSSNIALTLQYELLPNKLNYKVNLGRNTWNFRRKFFQPQFLLFNVEGSFVPGASREDAVLREGFIFNQNNSIENSLNYFQDFGKHNINLLALASYETFNSKTVNTGVLGLASNDTPVLSQGEEAATPSGFDSEQRISGLLGRLQYNYDDRYLLSASIRRDGSSNFSAENRFQNFFGVSVGWNVSEEKFFQNSESLDFISNLKFRGSIGEVGNQTIAPYSFTPIIESGVNFILGQDDLQFGLIGRRLVDPDIEWETKISRNVGVDLYMFKNKFNFSADYYFNDRNELLLQERLAPSTGTNAPRDNTFRSRVINAGDLTNEGIELAFGYKNTTKKGLKWSLQGTFTRNVNTVTDLNGTARGFAGGVPLSTFGNTDSTTFLAEGFEAGAFFLLQNNGVVKTEDQLLAYQQLVPDARIGDIAYVDQQGDGVINDDDRVYAGSGQSEFEAGLNISLDYKGFDLFVQNYLAYGAEIYNGGRLAAFVYGRSLEQLDQWSVANVNSDVPARRAGFVTSSTRARSDFFIEDGTYLRIRNITLGYSIPKTSLPKAIEGIRLYASSQNPFTFTNYTGFDPEVGGDGIFTRGVDALNYPVTRRFLLGLQVKF